MRLPLGLLPVDFCLRALQAPRTSDNFLRLCEKSYYDNTAGSCEVSGGASIRLRGVLRLLVCRFSTD